MNREQMETHLTDIQRQIKKLFDRRGIDPLHLLNLIVYSTSERVMEMIFDEVESVELDEWLEIRDQLLQEIEMAFCDACKIQKKKRRIL